MEKLKSLTEIGKQYGTDKALTHNFTDWYESKLSYLRFNKINLLEVGIGHGTSLQMWRDYFVNGYIYGADIVNKFEDNRIVTAIFDQKVEEDYDKLFPEVSFDVIVDDAGHLMYEQQLGFVKMFNRLKHGGFYIIEDLHTSLSELEHNYPTWQFRPLTYQGKQTTLQLVENIINKKMDYKNFYVDENYILNTIHQISSAEIFYNKLTESITSIIVKNGV